MRVRSHFGSSGRGFESSVSNHPFIGPGAAMAPKNTNQGNYTIHNIPVENVIPNPFLELPTLAKSREIMQDIGDAQKWTTKMGALLKHSPQQCHAVADILTRGCACLSDAEAEGVYRYLYPGFSSAVYWIYENAETVEQTKLYELLYQISQEEDVNKLEPSEAQCCSSRMLHDVSRRIAVDHMKKTHVQLVEFLASGGQMPDRHEWNLAEMLKGSGLEQRVQPKSK